MIIQHNFTKMIIIHKKIIRLILIKTKIKVKNKNKNLSFKIIYKINQNFNILIILYKKLLIFKTKK
jgi:hypothetical protein